MCINFAHDLFWRPSAVLGVAHRVLHINHTFHPESICDSFLEALVCKSTRTKEIRQRSATIYNGQRTTANIYVITCLSCNLGSAAHG